MAQDFDLVRASFESSWPARAWAGLQRISASAWRTSSFRTAIQEPVVRLSGVSVTALIRIIAVAIAVAAALQPLLMSMLPLAVKPALPAYAFIAIAVISAVAASRPDAIAAAWPASWVGRRWPRR